MGDTCNLVTVSCPNHYETLAGGLWNFISTKYRVDYSVKVRGRMVCAHQLILDVFLPPEKLDRRALSENRDILEALFQFMYTGCVAVRTDKLERLLSIGVRLDFKLLVDAVKAATGGGGPATGSGSECGQPTDTESEFSTTNTRTRRKGNPVKIPHPVSTLVVAEQDGVAMGQPPAKKRVRTDLRIEKIAGLVTEEDCDSQNGLQDLDLAVDHPDGSLEDAPSSNESCQPDEDDEEPTLEESDEDYIPKAFKLTRATSTRRNRPRPAAKNNTPTSTDTGVCCAVTEEAEAVTASSGNCDRLRQYNRSHPVIRCQQKPCKFRSRSENTYQVHLATEHSSGRELFPCPTCARPFIDAALLERHRRFKHRKPKGDEVDCTEFHYCPHCDYKTRYKVRYEVHMNRRHGESNAEIFRCDKCSIVFLQSDAFERHKRSHKQYKCTHCDFETTKKWTYSHHLFSVHRVNEKGQSVDKIPCPHCDYKGKNNCVLRYHIATRHTATFDKPYKCTFAPECNYASGRKGDRDKHVKIAHLGQKNYMCEFCSFRTITPFSLELHRRTHTLERPFKCTFCEKKFSGKDSLRKHTKLHTSNEKNHLCHLCTFACNRRDNLRTHLKGVHKNQVAHLDPGAI